MPGSELATAYISLAIASPKKGISDPIRRELGLAEGYAQKSGTSMGAKLGGAVKTGAKIAGAGIIAILGTSLVKGFSRLSTIDQATAKLTGLGHSAKGVQAIMTDALASVKGTAFGMGEAAATAAGAVAAGVRPGKDLERTLRLVADAATIGGTSMGEMGSIFNKVATSNKVQGEVIAQLSDRGIPIIQLLSKELGISAEETTKLASKGKINFETFRKAIESGMGGAALESGKTFQGALKNMWAAVGRIGANLLSGIFPELSGGLQEVTKWLGGVEAKALVVGKALGDGLQVAKKVVSQLISILQGDDNQAASGIKWAEPIMSAARKIRDMWPSVKSAMTSVFDYVKDTVIPTLKDAAGWIADNKDAILAAVAALGGMIALVRVVEWVRNARLAVLAFNAALRANPIGLVITAIALLVGGLVWLYQNNETARKIIDTAWSAIKAAIKAVVDWVVNTAWPFLKRAWDGISAAIDVAWNNVIKPALSALWSFMSTVLIPIIKSLWENVIKPNFALIGAAAKLLWDVWIKPNFDLIVWIFKEVVGPAATWLWESAIKPALDGIGAAVGWLWDKVIRPTLTFIVDKFLWFGQMIIEGAATAFGWVKEIGPKLKEAAKKFAIFRDDVNKALSGINDQTVNVGLKFNAYGSRINVPGLGRVNIGLRAEGGPVRAGQPYIVGERRPELFVPKTDGTILPRVPEGLGGGSVVSGASGWGEPMDLSPATLDRLAFKLANVLATADITASISDGALTRRAAYANTRGLG